MDVFLWTCFGMLVLFAFNWYTNYIHTKYRLGKPYFAMTSFFNAKEKSHVVSHAQPKKDSGHH